jgi:DNA-binding response OmpR family regulator
VRVLVLEDDPDLRRAVVRFLRSAGYVVDESADLADAEFKLDVSEYDVAVLDRSVPGGDSIDLVERLRSRRLTLPVLFLTALDGLPDRVAGLMAGGDDYLTKPFAMEELVARVHVLARRAPQRATAPVLRLADVELDPGTARVTRNGTPIELTPKEFVVLRYLFANIGTVASRSDLIEHCWDEHADPMSNVVDVRIAALRKKLGDPALIHTVRGAGFIAEARDTP